MTAGVFILEVTWVQPLKLHQRRKHTVIQNSLVGIGVELAMNWDQELQCIPAETLPDHNTTSAKLYHGQNAFWQEAFSSLMPNLNSAIRTVEGEP